MANPSQPKDGLKKLASCSACGEWLISERSCGVCRVKSDKMRNLAKEMLKDFGHRAAPKPGVSA